MPDRKIEFETSRLLNQLYFGSEEKLNDLEELFQVNVVARDNWLKLNGELESIDGVEEVFNILLLAKEQGSPIRPMDFKRISMAVKEGRGDEFKDIYSKPVSIKIKGRSIVPKNASQKKYLNSIVKNEVVFGIGPAGTGKTFLAIASALNALMAGQVERIILTRPAVEAGEALGFLPGDLQEKILPYLRPLYDSMEAIIGKEDTQKLIEKGLIEIAPLAYMRGRTLSGAYVILDEAQNATSEQMVMFLTRLGDDSRMVITGDITQVDLPKSKMSGLKQAVNILTDVEGVQLFYFEDADVVRHPIVQRIIAAYKKAESAESSIEG